MGLVGPSHICEDTLRQHVVVPEQGDHPVRAQQGRRLRGPDHRVDPLPRVTAGDQLEPPTPTVQVSNGATSTSSPRARATAAICASGSTPSTRTPRAAIAAATLPVPVPMSSANDGWVDS